MDRTSYAPPPSPRPRPSAPLRKTQRSSPTPKERRSMRQRVKRALRDVGHPPTYRYDLEHGIETQRTVPVGPMGCNVLNMPSRM
ncbi:hypothetical protein Ct61P_07508 [Colletotrichum tofieldiae]|nr:hypothetical protein Ct61P_07508 [Colletotrichum tofieldiae]